ncbi:ricin-type beta-trefoil lectin domain protein [Actinoplanes sp. NPDC049599]|uniref:ricin-type beta-trefoil lectin domain protein n=1 Tax=Actinoplanes sp. NPDC049599 TaxID=3363903 RepID=UPI00379B444F
MADDSERDDPVLVRPYITTQPGGGAAGPDDRAAQTWPAGADLPEDGTAEMAAVAAPAAAPDPVAKTTALRRQQLLVLAGIGVLALLGSAVLLLAGPDDPPAADRPAPTATALTGGPGQAPAASGGARSLAPSSPGRAATAARTATPTGTAPGAPGQNGTPPPASGAPAPTLSPPPDPARTGPITAAGGRCLALGSLLGLDGSPVQTAGCADVAYYQRWTLASDGTLRVADRCAGVGADATVRINPCDDTPAAQWRAGPDGSLVNPGTGRCLTDPGAALSTVTVTACTGAAEQRWTLP